MGSSGIVCPYGAESDLKLSFCMVSQAIVVLMGSSNIVCSSNICFVSIVINIFVHFDRKMKEPYPGNVVAEGSRLGSLLV